MRIRKEYVDQKTGDYAVGEVARTVRFVFGMITIVALCWLGYQAALLV